MKGSVEQVVEYIPQTIGRKTRDAIVFDSFSRWKFPFLDPFFFFSWMDHWPWLKDFRRFTDGHWWDGGTGTGTRPWIMRSLHFLYDLQHHTHHTHWMGISTPPPPPLMVWMVEPPLVNGHSGTRHSQPKLTITIHLPIMGRWEIKDKGWSIDRSSCSRIQGGLAVCVCSECVPSFTTTC